MSDEPPRKKMALDLLKSFPETTAKIKNIIPMPAEIASPEFKKLEKVFELLDVREQKTCRLVCKIWNEIVSTVMIKQDRCQISIEYYRDVFQKVHNRDCGHRSLHSDYQIKEEKSLKELIKCIENSFKFPCASFGLTFCNLSAEKVINLFALIGHQIKTLYLHESSYGNKTPLSAFLDVLQMKAPNVEKLQLDGFKFKWTDDDQLSLPSLTHLIFETHYHYIDGDIETKKRILQAANNLKFVGGFKLSLMDLYIETEKMQVIKSFTYRIKLNENVTDFVEDFVEFASFKPSLRFFSFGYEKKSSLNSLEMQKKLAKYFNSILESSKDSLEELKVGDWYYMNECEIPRLKNLKKLSIVNTRSPIWDGSFFPSGVNLCDTFPNLVYLCLELVELSENNWIRNIPIAQNFVGQLLTVKTLNISKLWDTEWLKTLHIMCPNFENLIVSASSNLFVDRWSSKPDFFIRICDLWSHLKGLEIIVTEENEEMPNFDPILTGLSWQDCKLLSRNWTSGKQMSKMMMSEYDAMERNSSILDLKDLKTFKLLFDLKTDEEWSASKRLSAPWDTMSMISVVYGFNLILKLKVTIGWNRAQDAYGGMNINEKELSQFVQFIHWINPSDIY